MPDGGPLVVLLTPVGLDRDAWQWVPLPDGAYLKYEFPGHGTRAWAPELRSLDALADDVAAAAPAGSPLHLVGVSFGGMVAQHVALRHPGRVASLLLACTPGYTDRDVLLARAEQASSGEDVDVTMRRWFTAEALATVPEPPGLRYARERLTAISGATMADSWRAMSGHDIRGLDRTADALVTCVAGDSDVSTRPEAVEELAGMWRKGRFVTVAGTHMFLLEAPARFGAVLREHLKEAGL
jgi:pimeloyl-ACP methyl ester carboxylesterase